MIGLEDIDSLGIGSPGMSLFVGSVVVEAGLPADR
jgi:hypothetical protein